MNNLQINSKEGKMKSFYFPKFLSNEARDSNLDSAGRETFLSLSVVKRGEIYTHTLSCNL